MIFNKDDTNSSNLELYSVIGEYDNAGFPLSYCLLSTATAMEVGKRKNALTAWAKCLRDTYEVTPVFAHTDKDMAEIGMLRDVWSAKIQLCWWHLRKAVRERLKKSKLSTTPYNVEHARLEFAFIDMAFIPHGRPDPSEYEGGMLNKLHMPDGQPPQPSLNTISIRLHVPPSLRQLPSSPPPSRTPTVEPMSTDIPVPKGPNDNEKLIIRIPPKSADDNGRNGPDPGLITPIQDNTDKHEFCPEELRSTIINMIETHLCAHPLIPGYSHPSAKGIREWAVKQMYQFCVKHDLREVWAYLWGNWYRSGRWELWARSCHHEIPVLKTTMILESQ